MLKKFIEKHLPHKKTISENKWLRVFGKVLYEQEYWHLHKRSVAKAFAAGLFAMWIPLPLQTVLAAAIALGIRANILISVALVWVSNPITMAPMLFITYTVGTWVLGIHPQPLHFEPSSQWLLTKLGEIWLPLFIGSVICGIVSGILGYFVVRLLWRLMVILQLKKRNHNRINNNLKK